jgi:hypothetical protein
MVQLLYFNRGIWDGHSLLNNLERWVRNDPRQQEWVNGKTSSVRDTLNGLAGDFIRLTTNVWRERERFEEKQHFYGLGMQKRLGLERLIWEHEDRWASRDLFSINDQSQRVKQLFEFNFTGPRAGSDQHRDVVAEYAHILQSKGRFVSVDRGAVESKLPDIRVWVPATSVYWTYHPAGEVEVEVEAQKKSDEAILRNLWKRDKTMPVRFVVMSERSCERVAALIKERTRIAPHRVENFPGEFNNLVEIELVISEHPFADFRQAATVEGAEEAKTRSLWPSHYPRIMTDREREKEKRDMEEAERAKRWQSAWERYDEGDDWELSMLRRTEYLKKVAEEDRQWFESHVKRGRRPRVLPRRSWPRPDS